MSLTALSGFSLYPIWSGWSLSSSGVAAAALDAAEELACNVIIVPKTGTVKKVGFRVSSRSGGDAVFRVTLETVATTIGAPVSTTYAGRTLYVANAESADVTIPGAAGVQWVAINGSTGVSVTAGDLMSIVVRCVSRTTGSMTVAVGSYTSVYGANQALPYQFTYLNAAAATGSRAGAFALEYDGEIVPIACCIPFGDVTANAWDSGDDPTFRGLKFSLPFPAKVGGIILGDFEYDYDFKIHAFDSDEFTEFTDFPITVDEDQRHADNDSYGIFPFKTPFSVLANTNYRIAIEPIETGADNVNWGYFTVADDGALPGMAAMGGGASLIYTSINDLPSSGSHSWADVATRRPCMGLLIGQVDDGAGFPHYGDMSGGKY